MAVMKNQAEYLARSVVIFISGLGQREQNPKQDGFRIATMISVKLKDAVDGLNNHSTHFLYGLLHKLDAPYAYVCTEGRIYDTTE